MLSLGDFKYDDYGSSWLIWTYFIIAIIVTNINFLNLLIAIISDTYARITESKQRYALMQRTEIYADFISIVKLNPKMTNHRFLYIVEPLGVSEDSADWAGSVHALK